MPWTELKAGSTKRGLSPRPSRSRFAVRRNKATAKSLALIVPHNFAVSDKAKVYTDGLRFAVEFTEAGDRKVFRATGASQNSQRVITITGVCDPTLIPFGTHDIGFTNDGQYFAFDLEEIILTAAVGTTLGRYTPDYDAICNKPFGHVAAE